MNRKISTLITAAENITPDELFEAPELSTLVTLDASLLATMNLLEFPNPSACRSRYEFPKNPEDVEKQIGESICILAIALRANLSAYYAAIQKNCDDDNDQQEVSF